MPRDPYDFPSGLIDDFDLDVSNAYFNYSTKLAGPGGGDPVVALHLEGKAEGGTLDQPTQLEGDSALLFSVGQRWMITNDGGTVVDQDGRDRTFGGGSTLAKFVRSAIEAGVPLRDLGPPQEAGIWKGLRLHLKRVKEEIQGKEKEVLRVSQYLGKSEDAGAAPATVTNINQANGGGGGDDLSLVQAAAGGPIFKRLQKLAGESADYATFASQAVELPKLRDDDGAQDIILDEERGTALWEQLKG